VSTSTRSIPIWVVSSAALIFVPIFSASLATVLLEALLAGREPASVNTRIPGWTYASATVMKVCLVTGIVTAVGSLTNFACRRWFPAKKAAPDVPQLGLPIWGLLSVALPSSAPLIGALTVLLSQVFVASPDGASMSYLSLVSRYGVLAMMAWIAASIVIGTLSLLYRERPHSLSILGILTSACLIGLFCYCRFYKLGFDQDRWAAP
jgi:hypothetical protein